MVFFLSLYVLNLVNAGDQSSQVSMKIKPGVLISNHNCQGIFFRELIDIDGEDALKTNMAGFGLIGKSPPK